MNLIYPKKGSTIKVEPIKSLRDIATIKRLLADRPRDYALFVIGINSNCYHQRVTFLVDLPQLMVVFNHAT